MDKEYIKDLNQSSTVVAMAKLMNHYCELQKASVRKPCYYCPFNHGICTSIQKEAERVEYNGVDC